MICACDGSTSNHSTQTHMNAQRYIEYIPKHQSTYLTYLRRNSRIGTYPTLESHLVSSCILYDEYFFGFKFKSNEHSNKQIMALNESITKYAEPKWMITHFHVSFFRLQRPKKKKKNVFNILSPWRMTNASVIAPVAQVKWQKNSISIWKHWAIYTLSVWCTQCTHNHTYSYFIEIFCSFSQIIVGSHSHRTHTRASVANDKTEGKKREKKRRERLHDEAHAPLQRCLYLGQPRIYRFMDVFVALWLLLLLLTLLLPRCYVSFVHTNPRCIIKLIIKMAEDTSFNSLSFWFRV